MFKLIFVTITVLLFSSCTTNKRDEAAKIIRSWKGKEIIFPKDVNCITPKTGLDMLNCPDLNSSSLKVLLYMSSTNCTGCGFRVNEWKHLVREADSLFSHSLQFVFFIHLKQNEIGILKTVLQDNEFQVPVWIDTDGAINKLNHFSDNTAYQCFLLNSNNRVLLVGNPVNRIEIWELYKHVIYQNVQESSK